MRACVRACVHYARECAQPHSYCAKTPPPMAAIFCMVSLHAALVCPTTHVACCTSCSARCTTHTAQCALCAACCMVHGVLVVRYAACCGLDGVRHGISQDSPTLHTDLVMVMYVTRRLVCLGCTRRACSMLHGAKGVCSIYKCARCPCTRLFTCPWMHTVRAGSYTSPVTCCKVWCTAWCNGTVDMPRRHSALPVGVFSEADEVKVHCRKPGPQLHWP